MPRKRDYAKEWQRDKERRSDEKIVGARVSVALATDFESQCAFNGTTKNAVLKSYIERYTYQGFDQ